jgi:DNA gyrase subunit A
MVINDAGVIIRMKVGEISVIGRDTQGVRLMNLGEDTKVAAVALVRAEEDEEETEEA